MSNGYENIYEVSSYGRIKSIKFSKIKYIKPKQNHGGYLEVLLYNKDGKRKTARVHRLVAEAFVPNPKNLPEVNHIDGDKTNNYINNLEWTSRSRNQKHAYKTGLMGSTTTIKNRAITNGKKACKPILQFDLDYNLIREWDSQTSASNELHISRRSISNCLRNKTNVAGGYKWEYKKEGGSKNEQKVSKCADGQGDKTDRRC